MRRRDRRRGAVALVAAALVLATGANGARAQTTDTSSPSGDTSLAAQFGGFKIDAHGEGLSMTYDSPGLIPGTPSPLFEAGLPESLSTMDNGPSGYALASLVYPGPVVSDLPSVLALAGVPNASSIPSYPVRSQAYFPSGPTTADQQIGAGRQTVRTDDSSATATTAFGAAQIPPVLDVGNIVSSTDTHLEQGQVVSRVRVELTNVNLALGLVHIDSIVTDLVATSNAADAATDGTTTVSGVTLLGLPATIDATGIHTQPPASSGSTTTTAGPLAPVGGALGPVDSALSSVMQSVLGTSSATMDQLLAASGISIRLLDPVETKSGADASRLANGLLVTMTYNGQTEPVLSQVLAAIPEQSLPSQGVGPIPFTSPQSMVEAMKATHIVTLSLGSGNVHSVAAPPFDLPSTGVASNLGTGSTSLGSTGSSTGSRFTTPTPSLGAGGGSGPGGSSVLAAVPIALSGAEPLAGVVALMVLLLAGAAFWVGSTKLADNVLAATSTSCPDGLDRPPTAGGTP